MFSHIHLLLFMSGILSALIALIWIHRRARIARTALQETEERNRLLLGHTNATIYTMTPDGVFTYVSPNWPRFLGHQADGVVGQNFRFVMIHEDVPAFTAFLNEVVQSGEPRSGVEYRVRHTSGTVHWHTSSITPVYHKRSRSMIYVGVAHDINELKQAQEKLRIANDNLNTLIASREEELRIAVNAALDAADVESCRIGLEIHNSLCQELVGLLRLTENAGNPAQSPILQEQAAQVLRLARSISHDLTLHDLETRTLPDALSAFASRFESVSGATIELNYASSLPGFSASDAGHIYRVIREAVVNALHHGKARHIWIDLVHEPQQIVVSVTDDGRAGSFDPANLTLGIGLRQVQLRSRLLGGTFTLKRNKDDKTVAELIIPCEAKKGVSHG